MLWASIGVYFRGKVSTKKHSMRQRFSQQQELGIAPIADIIIPKKDRHKLTQYLRPYNMFFYTGTKRAGI